MPVGVISPKIDSQAQIEGRPSLLFPHGLELGAAPDHAGPAGH